MRACQWACAYAYVEKNDRKKKEKKHTNHWRKENENAGRKKKRNSKESEKNTKKERRGINLIITREWKRYAHRKEEQ